MESKSYPLSFGQQAIWFIYQIDPQSVAYNIFITVKIKAPVNVPVFVKTWNRIFERHSILRTTYTTNSQDQPIQQICDKQELSLEVIDAQGWSEDELKERILTETDRPFNLEKDSVLRINLFTQSAKEHVLLLTMHHIAGDMWSFDLLLSEFQNLYTTEIKAVNLEQIEIVKDSSIQYPSYGDFVDWQSKVLSNSRGQKALQYWQKQLAGDLPILSLPTDKIRPIIQTYQGESYLVKLDEALIQKLKNLALISGTTLYKLLLTAFYIQIYRYTHQTDILVGSPMRGRGRGDFKKIIGYFVNLLPLRISLSGNATFTDLLSQVNKTIRNAQKYQDYPFSLLVEKFAPQRDPGVAPLCQVGFTWQRHGWYEPNRNSSYSQNKAFQMQPYLLGHQRGADRDLNLMVMEAEDVLQLCWQYNTSLFNPDTITRAAGHFVKLLEGIVANPQQTVAELPLLTQVEYEQLLTQWNDTATEYPQDKCIHQLFSQQVEKTPLAVAVVFEDQQLTYQQLNQKANQLAHHLKTLGVEPGLLVGICVEPSLEMVVGLLGILKAGGAYVPLDPNYPKQRLADILADTSAPIVVTKVSVLASLPESQAKVLCIDRDWETIAQQSLDNPAQIVNSSHLAYTIFTSGSTGKPKGAGVFHRGLTNLLWWYITEFNLPELERVLLTTSLSFDLTQKNIYAPLISGGTLHILPAGVYDPQKIIQQIDNHAIAWVNCTPSMFYTLLDTLGKDSFSKLSSLRYVFLGGEPIQVSILRDWLKAPECNATIVNTYGPTECTDVCAFYRLDHPENFLNKSVPIGHAISDTQLIILDNNHNLMPIGVVGELCIAGAGVGLGYINNQERTAQQFIPNPFGEGYLYKTGDLARYHQDGNIEFLGRIDHQIKMRGFRIELGEIEAVLNTHPQIQQAVVIAKEEIGDRKRLVTYVVTEGELITSQQLREFLRHKLPEYMVPSAFVTL
ncbi:MAG: amino acid adenylation domain-containing protein, partial [Cyanobacteria bacterium P01_A01_bin.80]